MAVKANSQKKLKITPTPEMLWLIKKYDLGGGEGLVLSGIDFIQRSDKALNEIGAGVLF